MLVQELRELLEELNDEWEVRLAHQPTWPLAHHIKGVVKFPDEEEYDEDELSVEELEEIENGEVDIETPIVWIVACQGNCSDHPYAPKELWDRC